MSVYFSLDQIIVRRGENFRLQVPSLELSRGGLYAVLGGNGAGKSTLLNLLALLNPPDRGTLHIEGHMVDWHPARLHQLRQQITLVEQHPYLLAGKVADNLAYGLSRRAVRREDLAGRIGSSLEQVGLVGYEARCAAELSRGEIQRVALARALARQPQVLLLDEPTSNSDAAHQALFERLLSSLLERGVTVVFATHDLHQARRLGAELINLKNGHIVVPPQFLPELSNNAHKDSSQCPSPMLMPKASS